MNLFTRQLATYAGVGAIGTGVHFAILIAMVQGASQPPLVGSVLGFLAGAVTNYLLNHHVTFNSRSNYLATSWKFFLIAGFGLLVNTLVMAAATPWLHYLLSQATATAAVLLLTFLLNRCWTFRGDDLVNE